MSLSCLVPGQYCCSETRDLLKDALPTELPRRGSHCQIILEPVFLFYGMTRIYFPIYAVCTVAQDTLSAVVPTANNLKRLSKFGFR